MDANQTLIARWLDRAADFGSLPTDSDEERLKKAILILLAGIGAFVIEPLWSLVYFLLGVPAAAIFPFIFIFVSLVAFTYIGVTKRAGPFPYILAGYNLIGVIGIHAALGGFSGSSAIMFFALFTPIGVLLFVGRRPALPWLALFIIILLIAGLTNVALSQSAAFLPQSVITAFYVMNIGAVCVLFFFIIMYFMVERDRAQERSDQLLLNILPKTIAERLRKNPGIIADRFDEVTILYADIVGFTPLSARSSPEQMVTWLNDVYSHFDLLAEKYRVEKIRTIGDNYMVAAGVPDPRPDHAEALARFALDLRKYIQSCPPIDGQRVSFRVGINSGPIIGGIIGQHKFQYDLWGDTVNIASRMESQGEPGQIQISRATYERLRDAFECEPRGTIDVKGKGTMETWFLTAEK